MNNAHIPQQSEHRFLFGAFAGALTGAFAGAALALYYAPKMRSEIRERISDSTRDLQVRVGDAVEDLTEKGRRLRNDVADAVARGARDVEQGARDVEQFAAAAKGGR